MTKKKERLFKNGKNSPTIVKRNVALAMTIATQRSLILSLFAFRTLPLLSSLVLSRLHVGRETLPTTRLLAFRKEIYNRGRIVARASYRVTLRIDSPREKKTKGTRTREYSRRRIENFQFLVGCM